MSLAAEHRLSGTRASGTAARGLSRGLWSPGSLAVVCGLCGSNGLWDLPAEIQPGSAAFARGFSTTAPLDESSELLVIVVFVFMYMFPPEL